MLTAIFFEVRCEQTIHHDQRKHASINFIVFLLMLTWFIRADTEQSILQNQKSNSVELYFNCIQSAFQKTFLMGYVESSEHTKDLFSFILLGV